jgi:murein DD-endopeptidase MepM/ murein hydrolase activator NlpD
LKLSAARNITYTMVGVISVVAVRVTPPLPPSPTAGVAASAIPTPRLGFGDVAVRPIDLSAGAPSLFPVVVQPTTQPYLDTVAITGTISTSLYAALDNSDAGGLPRSARLELAWLLADIFEYRVDMARDLKVGDSFSILLERAEDPNGNVSIGKILAANLALSGQHVEAIRFDSRYATGEYFDSDGKSLRAAFLRAPLSFRRISSAFGMRRHPVLGRWRRHAGTDYSAPIGTPIRAISDGTIIFAGRRGGYGNVIDIRHKNGYMSRYGHLRNFAAGVTRGRRVTIGQTIGYVGMTGLTTGPHLHFEVLVSGVQRNPSVVLRSRGGQPIAQSERYDFQSTRERTLSALREFSRAAVGD